MGSQPVTMSFWGMAGVYDDLMAGDSVYYVVWFTIWET